MHQSQRGAAQTSQNFQKSKQLDWAVLFYATYFEHTVNAVIDVAARRKKFSHRDVASIIKDIGMAGKTTWLLRALGLAPLSQFHRNTILKINEIRNSYVHYKWQPKGSKIDSSAKEALKSVEKTALYIRRYTDRLMYGGQDKHLRKYMKGTR